MAITRLSGGLTPADGSDPRTFPTIWNATAEDVEAIDGRLNTVETVGFRYVGTRYFFEDGDFEKADPFDDGNPSGLVLRAIRVTLVGGGGGGGSRNALGGNGGGGAGGYAQSFITDIAGLDATVQVTRGAGGAGSAAGAGNAQPGGQSSFGTLVVGPGGSDCTDGISRAGGSETDAPTGDFVVRGAAGFNGGGRETEDGTADYTLAGQGGNSMLGPGGRSGFASATGDAGRDATGFGGGGGGAFQRGTINSRGGNGANGVVIVDCFV